MPLLVVGLNYRTAAVALREQLAIPPCALAEALTTLRRNPEISEALILSTCNRIELYVVSPDPLRARTCLREFLASRSHLPAEIVSAALYTHTDHEAVTHLFRVAAGLDSMVLGETEITAQVKQAYLTAQRQGTIGATLNILFQKALHSAKLMRTSTSIAEGTASVGSVVVTLARQCFGGSLASSEALLWGAGKAAETTARHLIKQGIGQLWIVNRTQAKAQELARLCQGGWLSWEQARSHVAHVDIAIVCTQAPHYVLDLEDLKTLLPQRAGRPLILIDLAVPRNIDPTVGRLAGVKLYDIDGLQTIAQAAYAQREQARLQCEMILNEQVGFMIERMEQRLHIEEGGCRKLEPLSLV